MTWAFEQLGGIAVADGVTEQILRRASANT